ncbi:MAG: DUF4328 domain-containing protein [Planctomycetes bacterium]|nr:DUF4328 domain-containing protein [Planctomycetota bacterium]
MPGRRHAFRPARSHARFVVVVFVAMAAVQLAQLVHHVFQWLDLCESRSMDDLFSLVSDRESGLLGSVLVLGQTLLLPLCAIAVIVWLRRAYENAASAGMRLRHGLGWSIGGWFVPIANLWVPVQIVGDTYRHALHRRSAAVVGLWWASFLAWSWLGQYPGVVVSTGRTMRSLAQALRYEMVADGLALASALLLIVIVVRTTGSQRVIGADVADVFGERAAAGSAVRGGPA